MDPIRIIMTGEQYLVITARMRLKRLKDIKPVFKSLDITELPAHIFFWKRIWWKEGRN